jgi:hypothetical protein
MKPERPEDIAYKAKLVEQQHAEDAMGEHWLSTLKRSSTLCISVSYKST